MKLRKTWIGLLLAVIYLGVFADTVYLALFDNREGCGTFFPDIVTFPWSLPLATLHRGTMHEMVVAMLKRLPGALVNAWIIYYLFKRADQKSKEKG
jgi:hypothetical protein